MSVEVIPTIIAKDIAQLKQKLAQVEDYVNWVQLDIMDGNFVDNKTWNEPEQLKEIAGKVNFEAHLMIKEPEKHYFPWIQAGVKRITFHFLATEEHKFLIDQIKKEGVQVGMAINPNVPIEVLDPFIMDLDVVLIMTVEPGKGGQALMPDTVVKVKRLHEAYPALAIQVDGGINLDNKKELVKAGASMLAIGSAIFNSENIRETINEFKK